MTATVRKGSGRPGATARTRKHAQRTPLAFDADGTTPVDIDTEGDHPELQNQYGLWQLGELRKKAKALGVKPLPRTKGGLMEAILETERAQDKTCEGMDGGDGSLTRVAATKLAKPGKAEPPPAATDPGETKSGRKAQVFGDYAGQQGWTVEYQPSGESVGVVASRGSEAVHQLWDAGVWQYEGSAYTIADRVTKPRNASGAKKLLERTAESAGAELVKVANNKAFRKKAKPVKRSKISFDPATASDLEVINAIAGKRVKWNNRLSGAVETGVVGTDVKMISVSVYEGERVVKFCCQEIGYRAFRLNALLEIGRGGKVAQKSPGDVQEAQAA